ncbi:MAG: sugar kinase [Cyclobacteriaceae bacterium]|nr:sugar kinase [Cyclobacteriaceae bacterium]
MKKIITFGEIMMRLSTPGYLRFVQADQFNVLYAGSEANVAVSLSYLGLPAEHVTRFPDNDFGLAATQSLKRYGVCTDHILYGDERIGVYFLENGSMQRSSTIIYDRFDSAFAHIQPGMIDWDTIMKEASWFHWTGITPALSQGAADVCREAIESARKNGATVSGDINYRRNLWQYGKSARDVMPALIESTDVVVAGIADMENCAGISGDTMEEASIKFMKTFPNTKKISTTIRKSISSSHNKIAAVLWSGKELIQSKEYDLTHIVDRVGSGDAFMAGLVYGMIKKWSDQQTIEFATAACALKHAVAGDVNLVTAQEIEALVCGENVGKLLR